MSFWGYRVDTKNRGYFYSEIIQGRLRQGWGYNKNQDLRLGEKMDVSARRNLPIYNKVKKGDILLIPHIESWDELVLVEAKEDFCSGYRFEMSDEYGDYGHIFPVKLLKCFSRNNINVEGDIRETLKCRSRFWNINRCEEQINKLLQNKDSDLRSSSTFEERFRNSIERIFDEERFSEEVYKELNKATQSSEWEYILCEGFRKWLPDSYSIETTSNKIENLHGSDIIIRVPGIMNNSYIIAIQVKDYSGKVDLKVIDQIKKADKYFLKDEETELIDKYIIFTKAFPEDNKVLIEKAKESGVKLLFANDVKKLLMQMGKAFIGESVEDQYK